MLQVDPKAFEDVQTALLGCVITVTDLGGLRIVPPSMTEEDFRCAATLALMTLLRTWVKPTNVKILVPGGGSV